MKKLITFIKQQKILILLSITGLFLKLPFLAKWLDDWDSVQLAMGLHEYSLPKHQPHPPGYPIYILMGKILLPFFGSDILTMTVMSALFGTLTLIPLYLLTKKIFNQQLAVLSCILFSFTPVVWLLSETALTDIVGLFFLTLTVFLFYRFIDDEHSSSTNKKKTVWVSLLAGISIGIRFNEFPILLGILGWVFWKQRDFKYAFYQLMAFCIGGLLWLIPMILITGPIQFYQTFTSNGGYVISHDVLLGTSHSVLGLLKAKIILLIPLFKWGYTLIFTILFLACFIWTLLQKRLYKQNWYQFTLIYLISYCLLLFTFYNLELPRHILPLIIPMILITIYAFNFLIKKNNLFWLLPFILFAIISNQAYSQVSRFHNALPSTIAPVQYVKQNFDPNTTVIMASYTLRNFQYYAPEFKSLDSSGDKSVITPDKTVIVDLPDLAKDPILNNFEEVDIQYFQSDKDIFPKVDSIQLHILKYKLR